MKKKTKILWYVLCMILAVFYALCDAYLFSQDIFSDSTDNPEFFQWYREHLSDSGTIDSSIHIFVLGLYDSVKAEICKERGHIWETVWIEDVYFPLQIIDLENKTIQVQCYNGQHQVCRRCGKERRYKPPCDTLIIWKKEK